MLDRLKKGPIRLSGVKRPLDRGGHPRSVIDTRTAMGLMKKGLALYVRRETEDDPFVLFLEITPEGKDTR